MFTASGYTTAGTTALPSAFNRAALCGTLPAGTVRGGSQACCDSPSPAGQPRHPPAPSSPAGSP